VGGGVGGPYLLVSASLVTLRDVTFHMLSVCTGGQEFTDRLHSLTLAPIGGPRPPSKAWTERIALLQVRESTVAV
jgi:hypothetical protein